MASTVEAQTAEEAKGFSKAVWVVWPEARKIDLHIPASRNLIHFGTVVRVFIY